MVKMTAGMAPMNSMRIVRLAKKRAISDAETAGAFPNVGSAILKMIAGTTLMNPKKLVPDDTENVQNPNLGVTMTSVFRDVGNVIMMMIVVTDQMKILVMIILVLRPNSNVIPDTASKRN